MPKKGFKQTELTKENMKKARNKGIVEGRIKPWNKGLTKENDERIKKISENLLGKHPTKETILKQRKARKGKTYISSEVES